MTENQIKETTGDTLGTVAGNRGSLYIDAGPLFVGFQDGKDGGTRVVQDGTFIAISQGVDYEDGDRATVGHSLSADDARELAALLEEAADNVEQTRQASNDSEDEQDSAGFLRRIVGWSE